MESYEGGGAVDVDGDGKLDIQPRRPFWACPKYRQGSCRISASTAHDHHGIAEVATITVKHAQTDEARIMSNAAQGRSFGSLRDTAERVCSPSFPNREP
jgi:hypothetical protein